MNTNRDNRSHKFHEKVQFWSYQGGDGIALGGSQRVIDQARPTIHFLHGNGFASLSYAQFLSHLAESFNLFLQDTAGHGRSGVGRRFIGWNRTATQCRAVLDKMAPIQGPMIGMGHSFGGCITALMSAQQPKLFDQLILLDPALFPPKLIWLMRGMKISGLLTQLPLAKQARRRRTSWDSHEQVEHYFTGRGAFKGWHKDSLQDYFEHSLRHDQQDHHQLICPPWMEAAIFSSYPARLWGHLKRIQVPTHIIMGADTFPFFRMAYEQAARVNANITLIEIAGGHCFMQENPAKAAQQVLALLPTK